MNKKFGLLLVLAFVVAGAAFGRGPRKTAAGSPDDQIAGDPPPAAETESRAESVHPLLAEDRFDLDGFNVFAISSFLMPSLNGFYGFSSIGTTWTLFEQYRPDTFFSPSVFLSYSFRYREEEASRHGWVNAHNWGGGVVFKHRFPRNRVLWNLGTSLEFMWAWTYYDDDEYDEYSGHTSYVSYSGEVFLVGVGARTGFTFRFNPYNSFDLNYAVKIPFGTLVARPEYRGLYGYGGYGSGYNYERDLPNKTIWPAVAGVEMGFTLWFPYRSRGQSGAAAAGTGRQESNAMAADTERQEDSAAAADAGKQKSNATPTNPRRGGHR